MIKAWFKTVYKRWLKAGCARHGHDYVKAWVEAPYFVTKCLYCGQQERVPFFWPEDRVTPELEIARKHLAVAHQRAGEAEGRATQLTLEIERLRKNKDGVK